MRGGGRKVGFIGLGNMGGPMAVNLKKKGEYDVIGFDLSEKTRETYKNEGIAVTGDLKSIFK